MNAIALLSLKCACGSHMLSYMFSNPNHEYKDPPVEWIQCLNSGCEHYGKKFKLPTVFLEELI